MSTPPEPVKSKRGGARVGTGGAMPGAGRPPKPPAYSTETDMLKLLQDVARGVTNATALQVQAAIASLRYTHRPANVKLGKKERAAEDAAKVATGKFGPSAAPLRVVNGKG